MKSRWRVCADMTLCSLICLCTVPALFQFIAIPEALLLAKPDDPVCDFYQSMRSGWVCDRWGDLMHDPTPTVIGLVCTSILFFVLRIGRREALPWHYVFVVISAQSLFVCVMALVLRMPYIVFGFVDLAFLSSLLPLALLSVPCLLSIRAARTRSLRPGAVETERRKKQVFGIETEISERLKERSAKQRRLPP